MALRGAVVLSVFFLVGTPIPHTEGGAHLIEVTEADGHVPLLNEGRLEGMTWGVRSSPTGCDDPVPYRDIEFVGVAVAVIVQRGVARRTIALEEALGRGAVGLDASASGSLVPRLALLDRFDQSCFRSTTLVGVRKLLGDLHG
jgi:hypothetical protein